MRGVSQFKGGGRLGKWPKGGGMLKKILRLKIFIN